MTKELNVNTSFYIQQVFLLFCPPPSAYATASSLVVWNVDGALLFFCSSSSSSSLRNELLTHNLSEAPQDTRNIKRGYYLFSIADETTHSQSFTVHVRSRLHRTTAHFSLRQLDVDGAACSLLWLWDNFGRRNDWNIGRNFLFTGETSLKTLQQKKRKKEIKKGGFWTGLYNYSFAVCVCVSFFLIFLIRGRNYCSQPWVVTPFSWPNLTEDE